MRALAALTLLSNSPPVSVLGRNSARFRGLSRVFVPAPLAMRTVSKPAQHAAAFSTFAAALMTCKKYRHHVANGSFFAPLVPSA